MTESAQKRRSDLEKNVKVWPRNTIASHFRAQAQKYPDRDLVVTAERHITYGDLWNAVGNVSRSLIALGVKRRDHVAVLMANEPEYAFIKIAIAAVGAVAVPLNTMMKVDELSYMLSQSKSKWMFMHQMAAGIDHEKSIAKIIDESTASSNPLQINKVVVFAEPGRHVYEKFMSYDEFERLATDTPAKQFEERYQESLYPDEVSDIIYTSGTTGLPKGVMLTHDMLLRCGFSTALSRAFEDRRRVFTPLPMYHVFAYVEGLLAASFVGGSLITMPSFRPALALKLMSEKKAQDLLCVPSILLAIVNEAERVSYDISDLYAVMCAAAPAPLPLWERSVKVLGLRELCSGYGGTEATAATVHTEVGDPINIVANKVGRIKPGGSSGLPEFGGRNVQYKVIEPISGEDLPEHAIGELVVRGNFVTRGYFDKPIETAALIDKDGWFRTGDLGRIDENGYLEFLGRSKELFKVSGENVSPKEIEDVISKMPEVNQCYVVGVPFLPTQEIGAAFVELKEGKTLTRHQVTQWCLQHLAKFKVPRYVWFVEKDYWPMTGTGKIQKFMLSQMAQDRISGNQEQPEEID